MKMENDIVRHYPYISDRGLRGFLKSNVRGSDGIPIGITENSPAL